MKGYLGSLWRSIFEPYEHPPIFVAGLLLLGFAVTQMSNFLSALIASYVPVLSWSGAAIAFVLPVLLVGLAFRLRPGPELTTRGPARVSKGLVVMVSKGPGLATARAAIEHHLSVLERAWLLHSELSRGEAEALKADYAQRVRGELVLVPLSDSEFKDVEAVWEAIERRVYANLPNGWRQSDVIIDYTGGPKEAGIGAFLAALPPGRRMERTPALVEDPNRAWGETPGTPIEVDISYRLWRVKPLRHPFRQ